jgi:hypothetical protein
MSSLEDLYVLGFRKSKKRLSGVLLNQLDTALLERRVKGKRSKFLSITHKLNSDHDSQFYVGESRHSPPDHGVARWGIVGTIEIAP